MCILFIHVDPHPKEGDYRLIVAANRDEHYRRPAKPAARYEDINLIGGMDMEHGKEGGMWLGFSTKDLKNGKGKKYCFSALSNITGELTENPDGRGVIVRDYLTTSQEFPEYVKDLETGKKFNGYNLIAVELSTNGTYTYHHGNIPVVDSVYSGKHTLGFGNSPTFCPLNKVTEGRYKFQNILTKGLNDEALIEELLQLLKDTTRWLPDKELQRRAPSAYELLSSVFVKIDPAGYGTRTHSIILIDYDWNLQFIEHTMEQPIDIENPKWTITKIESKL